MRPREFDHDEVLRIAFDQFWRKGVRGASLSDIAREAGVQRGSLYNAFGSKEALFLQAYERYAEDYLAALQKTLATGSLRKRLTAFFDLTISNFRSGTPPRGCPTTRGLMETRCRRRRGAGRRRARGLCKPHRGHHRACSGHVVGRRGARRVRWQSRGRGTAHRHRDARSRRARTGLRRRAAIAQDRRAHHRSRARPERRLIVSTAPAR
ncbi:TetR/AcrR family transcriptional regulator [Bradyrhizobium guangxiense]